MEQKNINDLPIEGHACEFPMWSYSKKRSGIKQVRIEYPDNSYVEIGAPYGFPSIQFPGYLDVILKHCQEDLFKQNYVEISVYSIFQELGLDPDNGENYRRFRADMKKAFAMIIETNRFRDPLTGKRTHTSYFRILNSMDIAHRRQTKSRFYFNERYLESFRSGYMKHLNYDFCLQLDRGNQALARFLYQHIKKRIGVGHYYIRDFDGFLTDVGLGYMVEKAQKDKNRDLKRTFYPALDVIKGEVFRGYELVDNNRNIVFYSHDARFDIHEYRARSNFSRKNRKAHQKIAMEFPSLYVRQVEIAKRQGTQNYYEDLYEECLKRI